MTKRCIQATIVTVLTATLVLPPFRFRPTGATKQQLSSCSSGRALLPQSRNYEPQGKKGHFK